MTWRTSRTMRMKLRDVGDQKTFIFKLGDREDTCGLLYYEDRSTGANSETKYISNSNSFTTCACAIFMGQRSNNKNKPCGSWVLSQWITQQRGRAGRHKNESRGDQEVGGQ